MAIVVAVQRYGTPVFDALSEVVRAAKAADPLAPVTVVVERGRLGLAVRRRLAAAPGGVANVRFLQWARLAAELGGAAPGGARPLSAAAVHEAVRGVLAETPGPLGAARDQPGTVRASARTYRDLAGAGPAALAALARQGPQAAAMVALVDAVGARLAAFDDETAVLARATAALGRDPSRAAALGPVVVYLPHRLRPPEEELLVALGAGAAVTVVVGVTGDHEADRGAHALLERLSRHGGSPAAPGPPPDRGPPASGARVATTPAPVAWPAWAWLAPDAETEVLAALRRLLAHASRGTPLDRMALVFPAVAPYPRLVHELVGRAGVPAHGVAPRSLAATVTGRVLLGALALPEARFRRDQVAAWWSAGPLRHDGRPVPAAEWDALSCDAGVVEGLDQWEARLGAYGARRAADAARLDTGDRAALGAPDDRAEGVDPGARARRLAREAASCERLARFVGDVARALADPHRSWDGWARWAVAFLGGVLGSPAQRAGWPDDEVAAHDAVVAVVDDLGTLDAIGGPPPRLADFRTALAAELETPAPETARFGRGLLCAPVADAVGLDLDVVEMVGLVDGVWPVPAADDVLVPDRVRAQADGAIPLRAAGADDARRDTLAVVAGTGEAVLSCPVADQRTGRPLRPARLFLDAVATLPGAPPGAARLYAGDLLAGAGVPLSPALGRLASYPAAVQGDGEPVSVTDWALRSLLRWRAQGHRCGAHFLAADEPVLAGALALRRGRRSRRFTRFDGRVRGVAVPSPATGAPQSATGLETYARCPRRYLLGHVLGLAPRERPEAVLELSPRERGILVHAVLEQLVAPEVDAAPAEEGKPGAEPGGAGVRARVDAAAAAVFAEWEADGATGVPALWALEKARILGDVRQFVRDDERYRAEHGARPVAVEERFGWDGPPVAIDVGGGRRVVLRGRIDRIDQVGDPAAGLVVIDYKSGSPQSFDPAADPVDGGRRLQLPVYALAARDRIGAPDVPVAAGYWYVGRGSPPDLLEVTPAVQDRLAAAVGAIADAVGAGAFPANPGDSDERGQTETGTNCGICPFDRLCPPDRLASFSRKVQDDAVAPYRALAAPG